jgi:TRAP-type mannitol/chloroaromatic compound transport system permease large subunit
MTGNEILGLIMLASMMGIIFVGVPISFTLLYIALVFGSIGLGLDPTFNLAYLQIWASMKDDILPAVPLFIFMGFMSEQAGLMNRLSDMGKLLVIMAIIFLLGWPFEWPAVVLVFLPIFLPVVEALNIGLPKQELMLWFGVVVAVNLQTAFLSPPVAMSAYYLKNVMPQWGLGMIYKGMGQFMVIQVVCVLLLLIWPELVLWLPRALR